MRALDSRRARLLLVEGERDKAIFTAMLHYLDRQDQVQIAAYNGKNNLCNALHYLRHTSLFQQGKLTSIGITRDADEQGWGPSLQSLRAALYRAGLICTEKDLIPSLPHLSIAAHIISDSSGRGRLEEMVLEAVQHYPIMDYVEQQYRLLHRDLGRAYSFDRGKVLLSIFLNCQSNFDIRLQPHYLNLDHPVYDGVKDFLRGL